MPMESWEAAYRELEHDRDTIQELYTVTVKELHKARVRIKELEEIADRHIALAEQWFKNSGGESGCNCPDCMRYHPVLKKNFDG